MRLDHIVIHVDNDEPKLQDLKRTLNAQGYPFDPNRGRRSPGVRVSNINIGDEYIEIVRLRRRGVKSWMPLWAYRYDAGARGAYCIFLEVEDVERTAVALKRSGVAALGPAVLNYPLLMGLLHPTAPYFIYYMPDFTGTNLHIALMQYNQPEDRERALDSLYPNAQQNGINGIRRVEVDIPALQDDLPMLRLIFPDLCEENGAWVSLIEKTRMAFKQSPDGQTRVRVHAVTSQRKRVGQSVAIDNVELITTGG